jgi:hypothetical protein
MGSGALSVILLLLCPVLFFSSFWALVMAVRLMAERRCGD